MLAERDEHRVGPAVAKDLRIDEVVVKDGIGAVENLDRAERDQAGIARPSADEIDFTLCHYLVPTALCGDRGEVFNWRNATEGVPYRIP